jgi:hypothetical protein
VQAAAPLRALLDALADRIDGVPPPLDAAGWAAFADTAARHGVSALAHRALAGRGTVPSDVLRSLEAHTLKNRLRNMRLYAHLAELLAALHAASIDVVVLKGAFLAQAVYPDPALRAMSDVDLLVRERDLERAASALRAMGWREGDALPAGGHQLPTFDREGVQVELHWTIEDDGAPFAIDIDGLWARAVPASIGRARALALAPEDLLLHLCLHTAYGHGWKQFDGGLRHLADIDAVVRHYGPAFDWDAFVDRALAWRVERTVWLCLATATGLLHATAPPAVLDRLAPPQARWTRVARELALGCHYADLARCMPVLARPWVDKHWRRLPRSARWREYALPPSASLARAYPALQGRAPLMLLAHWKDLAGEALQLLVDTRRRALVSRERERRALLAWMEAPPDPAN